ncbi:MAG: hypothetical protein QG597_1893 [Actinomycetota bacterium]|nr:hypothetical protein [Actinomycetota bacterium]
MAATDDQRGRGLGPTGETVRARIREIRGRTPVTELSERLEKLGRPIPPLGVRRIESGERRVDVDDLIVLAAALGVSPVTLLAPNTPNASDSVSVTATPEPVGAEELWKWLRADRPLPGGGKLTGQELLTFVADASPAWRARQYAEGVLEILETSETNRPPAN